MTTEKPDHPKIYGAPSVDYDPTNFDVLLRWFDMGDVATEARVPVEALPSLLRNLTNSATYAMAGAAESMAKGECATCSNFRMIETERPGGRTWQVHCPDCSPNGSITPFGNVPVIGQKRKEGF
jgi:hypothetical protein